MPHNLFAATMKSIFVHISRAVFNCFYKLFCLIVPRTDEVLFFSRKTNRPSYDFCELAREFEGMGWRPVILVKRLSAVNVLSYAWMVLREIYHLTRCRMCIIDRYDPVICMLDFKTSESDSPSAATLHCDFPDEPIVVQLWHAFGAYKKFGYQSLDTPEGHRSETLERFDIHRNYSWIVCSGEECRRAFAEAFAYPQERVIALHRPEYRKILATDVAGGRPSSKFSPARSAVVSEARDLSDGVPTGFETFPEDDPAERVDQGTVAGNTSVFDNRMTILLAPTLRKSKRSAHPFRELHARRDEFEPRINARIVWSFHPLDEGLSAPGDVPVDLLRADIVVTDYSSIVYEAYLLHKPTIFYVPDIESYRTSPGLNIDPVLVAPSICALDEDGLVSRIESFLTYPDTYDWEAFGRFSEGAFAGGRDDCVQVLIGLVKADERE